jgi:uncharacterized protein (DUF58 family)
MLAAGQRPDRLRAGSGIEFLDRRDYIPGDNLRDVDWRASARSRHPQVRRYCDEFSSDWSVLLDCSSSMALQPTAKWPLALQCAAAMSYLLLHLGHRVSILAFTDRVEHMLPPGRGYSHYAAILRGLRKITPAQTGSGSNLRSCVSRIRRDSPVFVISDFLAEDAMRDGLEKLSRRSGRLHSLQIVSDLDFREPQGSQLRLRDVETGKTITADIGAAEREEYRRSVRDFEDSLSAYCRAQRIPFSRHADDESWKAALTRHLLGSGNPR